MQIWGFLPPAFAQSPELPSGDVGGLCKDLKSRRISLKSQMEKDMKILHEPENQNLQMSDSSFGAYDK